MITKKESLPGRSSTSRSGANGPQVRVKQASGSGSSCSDVLQEHSYCISGAASSSGATNGCIGDEQVLHDERQQQPVIDQHQQQRPEDAQRSQQQQSAAGQQAQADTVTSERSRRVRRIPAKFMPDDRLFDDVAEFPHPVPADLPHAPSHSSECNKKPAAKADQKQNDAISASAARHKQQPAKEEVKEEDEDGDEEEEDEDDDDDDPYKEYCICRKPHGNRFMIACDHCEDWFHGSCIGISKKQSEQFESWVCQTCRDNDPGLTPVLKAGGVKQNKSQSQAQADSSKQQRRVSQTQSGSESGSDSGGEKRLRIASRSPAKAQRKRSSVSKQQKVRDKNGVLDEYEKADEKEKQRLREVIEKAKREHAEKVKRRERRQGPLDPTMNQLFQVSEPSLKSPTKSSPPDLLNQRIRCMICRSDRVNSDKTIFCSLNCIKSHVRKAKKMRHAADPQSTAESDAADPVPLLLYSVFDAFDPADVLDAKRKKEDVTEKELVHFLIRNPGYALDAGIKVKISSRKNSLERSDSRKSSVSDGGKTPTTPATPLTSHPLKRKSVTDADQTSPAGTHKHRDSVHDEHKSGEKDNKKEKGRSEDLHSQAVREKVSKVFLEALDKRVSEADYLDDGEKTKRRNMVTSLAKETEKSLFQLFQCEGRLADAALKNYLTKYRSLIFNFNNNKNQHLLESLFAPKGNESHVSPDEVVRMTPEELARGSALDTWRKIEAKKSLINSVIVSEEAGDGPKLKKTRKGEEEIQNDPGANDSHEHFVRTPELVSHVDKEAALNPLEMILKEIKSSSKSSNRRDDVEDVPKSPVRDVVSAGGRSRRVPEAAHSPPDAPISPDKRKKSIAFSDEELSSRLSSRTEVKRVKIAPEITSILSTSAGDEVSPDAAAGRRWSERKILWEGFCSGFEDPNVSSSFNPAMNSGSRFPVVCRTLVTDSETEPEKPPLPMALNVVGRIAPEQVSSYVQKLVQSTAASESIVEMIPLTLKHKHMHLFPNADSDFHDLNFEVDDDDDESLLFRENFNKFINYLSQRKRYAVVDVKSAAQSKKSNLKDVYLLPFDIPVTGEAAAVETRSSQLPSKMMADIFDNSPFTQEIRNLKPKKPISILIMLVIKKAGSTSSTGTRERSGSASSSSTTSSSTRSAAPRRLSSHPPRDQGIAEERSFTPPPPASAPQLPVYVPTPISRPAAADLVAAPAIKSHEREEYEPSSYIPGLSPDRNANAQQLAADSGGQRDEDELRQKALIQMRLLHSS